MATILRFDSERRWQAPRGGAPKGSAEILFFTGIRYERRPVEQFANKAPASYKNSRGAARRKPLTDTDA